MATKKRTAAVTTAPDVDVTSPARLVALVHQQAASGQIAPYEARKRAAALGADPDAVPVPCEAPGCTVVGPHRTRYSLIVCYAVFPNGQPAYGCDREQHYGCCHEHAIAAAHACLDAHLPHPDTVYPARTPA